jgi:hypothetical protein
MARQREMAVDDEARADGCWCTDTRSAAGEPPHVRYLRRCARCGQTWESWHCPHDAVQGQCAWCGARAPQVGGKHE